MRDALPIGTLLDSIGPIGHMRVLRDGKYEKKLICDTVRMG